MSHKEVQVFGEVFLNIQNIFFEDNFFNRIKLKFSLSRSKVMSKNLRKQFSKNDEKRVTKLNTFVFEKLNEKIILFIKECRMYFH